MEVWVPDWWHSQWPSRRCSQSHLSSITGSIYSFHIFSVDIYMCQAVGTQPAMGPSGALSRQ